MSSIVIRGAAKSDCTEVRRLIQELADFEKMSDGPKIDASILEKDGFGDNPLYQCYVAVEQSNPEALLGYCLYYYTISWEGKSMHMEDLYVTPAHRAKGVGTKLWKAIVKAGLAEGARLCTFQVLDWNVPSIEYYKRKGAFNATEKIGYEYFRMVKSEMEKFAAGLVTDDKVQIRTTSVIADFTAINEMHKELSEFMNIADQLHLTAQILIDASAATPPVCHLIVAETDGLIVGFAMYFYSYSTWEGICVYLEDIYVKKEYRNKNIGTLLWQTVVKRGLSVGCSRCDFRTVKDNASTIAYYERKGAVNTTKADGWLCMMLPEQAMKKLIES